MAFSRAQQGEYRRLENAAWQLHARRQNIDPKDKAARESWYRSELEKATGHRSTKDCNSGRHFEAACAHFEALAEDGINHQLGLVRGDLRRIRYAAKQINPAWSGQFPTDAALESYVRGIVAQAFRGRDIELHQLNDGQIRIVTQAVRIAAHRAEKV